MFEFAPQKRLHFSWEYRLFFKNSRSYKLSECVVYRIPNDLGHFRVGMTIKARGLSLDRNRAKRQIREFFRKNSDSLGSFDYNVVIPAYKKIQFPYAKALACCLQEQLLYALKSR